METVRDDMAEAEKQLKESGRHNMIPARPPRVFPAEECQPEWARQCIWDTRDIHDCVPLASFSSTDQPEQEARAEFFVEWGQLMGWPDADMIYQMSERGCLSRSSCERATVVFGHHSGLREHYGPARAAVEEDLKRGWVTAGRPDLQTVPARMVPKNVVGQVKWKLTGEGTLLQKQKWRVTTDDSASVPGARSRNDGINKEDISNVRLPTILQLAEAAAILQAVPGSREPQISKEELGDLTLWALDLSDAYRRVAAARDEWWLQSFVWHDGVRVDKRCVFGSAHLVDFFQRVSTFVLAVARRRIQQYERSHGYEGARESWREYRRKKQQTGDDSCTFMGIYLDDAFGVTCDAVHHTQGAEEKIVQLYTEVRRGGRLRVHLHVERKRSALHLAIVRRTFEEAGWAIAMEKVQRGDTIDLLGLAITVQNGGSLFVPEAKRRGLLADIARQRARKTEGVSVNRQEVEKLVGRLSHIALVVAEGNAYLQPMYRLSCAAFHGKKEQQTGVRLQRRPKRLRVSGKGATAAAYQNALDWWNEMLSQGVSTPLAPAKHFPALGGAHTAFIFTDAAREDGTGFGGFTWWQRGAASEFWYMAEQWDAAMLSDLQQNRVSMPAGEALGAVVLLDAVLERAVEVRYMFCFTDSDATAKAITAAGSGAPQLNWLMQWLMRKHRGVQFLGVHQRGLRNVASDSLSRGRVHEVLQEVQQTGAEIVQLTPSTGFRGVTNAIRTLPLRRTD